MPRIHYDFFSPALQSAPPFYITLILDVRVRAEIRHANQFNAVAVTFRAKRNVVKKPFHYSVARLGVFLHFPSA